MKALMKILRELDENIVWEKEKALIDDRLLDSFGLISLISELEDEFQIEIGAVHMIPENFNSVEAMWKLIQKLQGK